MTASNAYFLIFTLLCFGFASSCKTRNAHEGEGSTIEKLEQDQFRKAASARTAGLSYLQENKLEEAEAEFLKLIELAPNEALGYANLGIVYMRQDRLEDAEVQFEKALTLDESNLTNR